MNEPHGLYQVTVEDNIIILTLDGAFNEYAVMNFQKEIKNIVLSFDDKPFCILVDGLLFQGATPQAYEESNIHNQWMSTQNMLGKAHVHSSNALAEITHHLEKQSVDQNIREFRNVTDALQWLRSLS